MSKQKYKAIYFSDYPSEETKDKSITIAFSEPEEPYYTKIKDLSTQEIKELIGIKSYKQLSLYAEKEERSINQTIKRLIKKEVSNQEITKKNGIKSTDVTFVGSKEVPFQRWYPYIEGYSPDFIKKIINDYEIENIRIYEPFAGTGTTIFASNELGFDVSYSEVNPLLQFLIQVKIDVLKSSQGRRKDLAQKLLEINELLFLKLGNFNPDADLLNSYRIVFSDSKYFSEPVLEQIATLRSFIDVTKLEDELLAKVLIIAVMSCLLPVSFLKKAGDVRFKTPKELKNELKTLEEVLPQKIQDIAEDIQNFAYSLKSKPEFLLSNAKNIGKINDLKVGAIITSPPYLNGTNYFRNTKLELWFLKYLQSESDLRLFRDQVLTSGINDVKKEYAKSNGVDITSKSDLLKETLISLNEKAYDSRIPLMALSYFKEMYMIFSDVRKHLLPNSKILIDIGDSIFSNVHIKTDEILIELLQGLGFTFVDNKLLRKRRSRNKTILSQTLLVFEYSSNQKYSTPKSRISYPWRKHWNNFKTEIPHQKEPFSKRNWGHKNHSLCSYQGKLKPSIAFNLVDTFVPTEGSVLDIFSGVGTIPFEAALNGKMSYGLDISKPAYYISSAKVNTHSKSESENFINQIQDFISNHTCTEAELDEVRNFGFNKRLKDYYQEDTLKEIILSRRFISENPPENPTQMLVVSSLLHILHGNRPYALSRRSHPIVPYAPTGDFEYRSLITNVKEKVDRSLNAELPINFKPGKIFNQDTTEIWPQEINNLDAIITSPPFFDSTRFYLANWIRIWFSGWSEKDFKHQINSFVEEKQKKDFNIYYPIFNQARERLKKDGVFVLHLGKSVKCDMAKELTRVSKRWFKKADLFDESVAHVESHGIRDKGTVTSHQYLILS